MGNMLKIKELIKKTYNSLLNFAITISKLL